MKCCRCPLYHYWSNESDRGEACAIFGDGWDSPFQYEDKEGTIIGCYLDRHFIEKADAERDEYYASMAESMSQYFETENSSEKPNNCEELNAYRKCVESRSFWDNKHCDGCYFDERCPFDEPKDEPQTERSNE